MYNLIMSSSCSYTLWPYLIPGKWEAWSQILLSSVAKTLETSLPSFKRHILVTVHSMDYESITVRQVQQYQTLMNRSVSPSSLQILLTLVLQTPSRFGSWTTFVASSCLYSLEIRYGNPVWLNREFHRPKLSPRSCLMYTFQNSRHHLK